MYEGHLKFVSGKVAYTFSFVCSISWGKLSLAKHSLMYWNNRRGKKLNLNTGKMIKVITFWHANQAIPKLSRTIMNNQKMRQFFVQRPPSFFITYLWLTSWSRIFLNLDSLSPGPHTTGQDYLLIMTIDMWFGFQFQFMWIPFPKPSCLYYTSIALDSRRFIVLSICWRWQASGSLRGSILVLWTTVKECVEYSPSITCFSPWIHQWPSFAQDNQLSNGNTCWWTLLSGTFINGGINGGSCSSFVGEVK